MTERTLMRALIIENAETTQFRLGEIPRPIPLEHQVLVRIKASGVNPIDIKVRTGKAPHANLQYPAVLGTDLAGVVEAVGTKVASFKKGDEVYGLTGGVGGLQGSLAEFAAVDAALLALKPRNLSMREAAAVPLVFLTAWEGIVDRARVSKDQKALVIGGAGGVGHMAVQIALAQGANVFATASSAKHPLIERIGAVPLDRNTPLEKITASYTQNKGFDVIYDTVGGTLLDEAFANIRPYGHVVSCLGWGIHDLKPLSLRSGTYSGVFVLLPLLTGIGLAHHGASLSQATQLIEAGKLHPLLDPRHFTLATAQAAHEAVEKNTAIGKIIIAIEEPD